MTTAAFSTFRFSPVTLDTFGFPEGADEALGTLIEDNDHTSGKTSYSILPGDQMEAYSGEGSYNNVQSRALHLVQVKGLKNFDRYGDKGSFRKVVA
jgi:hypothetical protein